MSSRQTAVEHGPSGTIARMTRQGLQVLREGQELARLPGQGKLSVARDGTLLVGGEYLVDLAGKFPQKRQQLVLHAGLSSATAVLHPSGARLLGFRTGRRTAEQELGEDGPPHPDLGVKGLFEATWDGVKAATGKGELPRLWAGGRRRALWDQKLKPKRIAVWGGGPPAKVPDLTDDADLYLAPDGETWVISSIDQLLLGRGDRLFSHVCWSGDDVGLVPTQLTFDLGADRVLRTGRTGIVAFGLDGKVLAKHRAEKPLCCPVIPWRGDLLAIVSEEDEVSPGAERTYRVERYDPRTLDPMGPVPNMPTLRMTDDEPLLLPLSDGSLAFVPRDEPLILLPPPGTTPKASTPWHRVVGSGDVGAPRQDRRATRAGRLISDLNDGDAIRVLLTTDPDAFHTFADEACAWSDETLLQVEKLLPDEYGDLAYGASDAATTALAAKILLPKKRTIDKRRARLLIGVGTPAARLLLADLARGSKPLREVCARMGVEVPDRGPAIERFSRRVFHIVPVEGPVKHDVRVVCGTAGKKLLVDVNGWTCRGELQHVMSIDASGLAGFPSMGWFNWFVSACPLRCDEREVTYGYRIAGDGRLEVFAGNHRDRPPVEDRCEGGPPTGEISRRHWALVTADHPQAARGQGLVGGRPKWQRTPDSATCPRCRRPMFYVGHMAAHGIRDHHPDVWLYGYWCEDCSHGVQIGQPI